MRHFIVWENKKERGGVVRTGWRAVLGSKYKHFSFKISQHLNISL